jgi:pantoate--beta-alanine ligase
LKVLKTNTELQEALKSVRSVKNKLGFVPTMGALHEGHIDLVKKSIEENDFTIVSVFVNPKQFNNTEDFEKYPNTVQNDILLLEKAGCDYLFLPAFDAIYPSSYKAISIDLGTIDSVFEGPLRPGHFDGVVQVVNILFGLIQPDIAYFGLKDYQQCMVIKALRDQRFLNIQLSLCKTVRAGNGLALSSRNKRLSVAGLEKAAFIFKALKTVNELKKHIEPEDAIKYGIHILSSHQLEVEYFALANADTLQPSRKWLRSGKNVVLAAVWVEGVRLIDNLVF